MKIALIALAQLILAVEAGIAYGQTPAGASAEVTAISGIDAMLGTFDERPVIALGDLQGCTEFHDFIDQLVRDPRFVEKARVIIVDFGNPSLQSLVDRYVTKGDAVPPGELRHVWDDTTESPRLTWDSAVYARFFDTVRAVNAPLAHERRIRVILADAPIDWKAIEGRPQWLTCRGQKRETALADAIRHVLDDRQHALVIAAPAHLVRTSAGVKSARMLVDADHPGQVLTVLPQGTIGDDALRAKLEAGERTLAWNSMIDLRSSRFGLLAIAGTPGSQTLGEMAEGLLFLDEASRLTRVQAPGSLFQDDAFWNELNRRWSLVQPEPFDLAKAGFDASGTLDDVSRPLSNSVRERRSGSRPTGAEPVADAPSDAEAKDGIEFVLTMLDRFPLVALGDLHMCVEFHRFVKRLVRDPQLAGKVQEIIVEFGNPKYQALLDSYVLEGKAVPLEARRSIWQEAAMGWYAANSPVYAEFFDTVREVNLGLPKDHRIRVVLGDMPIDIEALRANPEQYLSTLGAHRETALDPREISLAASMNRALASGHRAIVIAGNGHLRAASGRENARTALEKDHPDAVFLIDANGPEYPGWRPGSIVVSSSDAEPHHAKLYLGEWESLTGVRPSPLLARDKSYWETINLVEKLTRRRSIDFASPPYDYTSLYFATPSR